MAFTHMCSNLVQNVDVSNLTHILGSWVKPMIMVISTFLISHRDYSTRKYLLVFLILLGLLILMVKNEYLVMFSVMDGFTYAFQEKVRSNSRAHPFSIIYYMNKWACVYLFICKFILSTIIY